MRYKRRQDRKGCYMRIGLTGRHSRVSVAARAGMMAVALLATLALGACTTVEGTNALTDFGTFERDVMNTTARGIGLIPGEAPKADLTQARAPLALPRSGNELPVPANQSAAAQLPADSNTVKIDTSSLSEADLAKISPGQPCRITPEAYPDHTYDGYVAEIAPEANRQKGTLQVKVQIKNPDQHLIPELSAKVDFLAAYPPGSASPAASATPPAGR